jgi:N-acetylneuraminate lyase
MTLSGLIPAVFTPFDATGSLNLPVVDKQVAAFVAGGISAVFVAGSTGECHSLTVDERVLLAQKWCSSAKGKLQVAVHVGHNCLKDARTLAVRAQVSGAAAISAMAPFGFKPAGVDELVSYLAEIASAAPGLPFYYYHIPSVTGVDFPIEQVLAAGAQRIGNFRGAKFTSFNLPQFSVALSLEGGRFNMLYGHDEALLAALAAGAEGAIGSTYNFAAPVYQRLWRAFEKGDWKTARQEQVFGVRLVEALVPFGFLRAAKTVMKWAGIDCGPVRPPLVAMTVDEQRRLYEAVKQLPVFSQTLEPGW